jgi:hypothetical protein
MHQSVKDRFLSFTESFEGGTSHGIRIMFLDAYNRVGTAAGIDLDMNAAGYSHDAAVAEREGMPKALRLIWKFKAGLPKAGQIAGKDDVIAEWRNIKKQKPNHWWEYYQQFTSLEATDDSLRSEVQKKLESNETFLKASPYYKDLDNWPADAQLALMSMAWSGPALVRYQFPQFGRYCQAMDFSHAAEQCRISGPGSLARRNAANSQLFRNAAAILEAGTSYGFEKSRLYYPVVVLRPLTV